MYTSPNHPPPSTHPTTQFLDALEKLASDKVPNVRLVLAKVVSDLANSEPLKNNSKLQALRTKIQEDGDSDVRYFSATGVTEG